MRMKAFRLAQVDKERDMALQAWMNHQVTATKTTGSGKNQKTVSVYKDFESFFDYEKRLKEIEKPKKSRLSPKQRKLAHIATKLNEGR